MTLSNQTVEIEALIEQLAPYGDEQRFLKPLQQLTQIGQPHAVAVKAVLELRQWWKNWGDYDSLGTATLQCLGAIGYGNVEAIAELEFTLRNSFNPKSYLPAANALEHLANQGDGLAIAALNRCTQPYKFVSPDLERNRALAKRILEQI